MNHDFGRMSTTELRSFLDEAEERIAEIRAELKCREETSQQAAIDELDLTVTRTAVDWGQVRTFFQQVLEELRGGRSS